jgi:hypothetical protein
MMEKKIQENRKNMKKRIIKELNNKLLKGRAELEKEE